MKFFPGQGNVREFCGWPGDSRRGLETQEKVWEFENKWLWQAVFRKSENLFILFNRGKDMIEELNKHLASVPIPKPVLYVFACMMIVKLK